MPVYRITRAAKLVGVSPDTMRRWADAGRVKMTRDQSGHRWLDGADLARLARELAGDQAQELGIRQSARNHIPGIITSVTKDNVVAQVELQAGMSRIVALITREAVDELGIEPGMLADAVVKATNVSVELPPGSSDALPTPPAAPSARHEADVVSPPPAKR